jgi:CRISPR system Cascade subunit CasE
MTTWLTRITLNTRSRAARTDLGDIVAMHRRLMSLLPDNLGTQARAQTGLLFRIDFPRTGTATVLAQSAVEPDLNRLPDDYGTAEQRPLGPLLDAITEGTTVRYRLAANASKRLWKGDERHRSGQIVALGGLDAEQWWRTRAERQHGLQITDLRSETLGTAHGSRGKATVVHGITRFDGAAIVRDPQAVRQAILTGIGRGKAYGCGLLSLAPACR